MKKFSLFLALGCVTFLSCNKSTIQDKNSDLVSIKFSGGNDPNFDFNTFGISHNSYLEYIFDNPNFHSLTNEQLYNYGGSYSDDYFGPIDQPLYSAFLSKFTNVKSIAHDMVHAENPSAILNGKGYSDGILLFWDSLSVLFKGIVFEDSAYLEPQQFSTKVENLENWVRNNYEVVIIPDENYSNDGAAMLAMCAIAKYSYEYWFNNIDQWINAPDSTTAHRPNVFRRVLNALDVAATDVGGYLDEIHIEKGRIWWNHKDAWSNAGDASRERGSELRN